MIVKGDFRGEFLVEKDFQVAIVVQASVVGRYRIAEQLERLLSINPSRQQGSYIGVLFPLVGIVGVAGDVVHVLDVFLELIFFLSFVMQHPQRISP